MKFILHCLLVIFISVSAYVTFTLTNSLANNLAESIFFSALGFALDILKSLLPATILLCFFYKSWGKLAATIITYICLTSFSFYASMNLFEQSTQRKIEDKAKTTVAYTSLETQLNNYQKSYDGLILLDRITKANTEYGDKIKDTARQMTALINDAKSNTVRNIGDLIMTLVISTLLELSVLACHISIFIRNSNVSRTHAQAHMKPVQKYNKKQVNADMYASARNQHATEFVSYSSCNVASETENAQNAHLGANKNVYKMSASELSALLQNNNDESLSYRKITAKYGVKNTDVIRDAKAIINQKEIKENKNEDESNIFLLPFGNKA